MFFLQKTDRIAVVSLHSNELIALAKDEKELIEQVVQSVALSPTGAP